MLVSGRVAFKFWVLHVSFFYRNNEEPCDLNISLFHGFDMAEWVDYTSLFFFLLGSNYEMIQFDEDTLPETNIFATGLPV